MIDYLNKIKVKNIIWMGPRIEPNIPIDYTYTKHYERYENNVNYNINLVDQTLEKKLKDSKINYISINKIVQFKLKNHFYNNNHFLFSDYDHWSKFGEKYFGRKILNQSFYISNLLNN